MTMTHAEIRIAKPRWHPLTEVDFDTARGLLCAMDGNAAYVRNDVGDWDRARCGDARIHPDADFCWDDDIDLWVEIDGG